MANIVAPNMPAMGGYSTWACIDKSLCDVLLSVNDKHLSQIENGSSNGIALCTWLSDAAAAAVEKERRAASGTCCPVLLEQTEEGSPCVLTLHCGSSSVISSLQVTSEAPTIEVYSSSGEYCGTCRGERDDSVHPDSEDRGPFYRKHLILDSPSISCEVKLLSLCGRKSVAVYGIILGLQPLLPPVADSPQALGLAPSIDMQQVQSLVKEMGTSLSPGAQNLMDMVHFQQKNQASALSGLLPLLVGGGALSALARGTARDRPRSAETPQVNATANGPVDPVPLVQSGTPPSQSHPSCSPGRPSPVYGVPNHTPRGESVLSASHAHLAEMMSHLLMEQRPNEGPGQAEHSAASLLPMLQTVCGQVTQLRLDDAAATAAAIEKERRAASGTWELDEAMERRLEDMEKRLKEHIDHRMDALEQKLEKALLTALPLVSLAPGTRAAAAPIGSSERTQTAHT